MRASFKEMVDFPSSRKNTGPCTVGVTGREEEIINLQYVFKLPDTESLSSKKSLVIFSQC